MISSFILKKYVISIFNLEKLIYVSLYFMPEVDVERQSCLC